MKSIISNIRKELKALSDPEIQSGMQRYFREEIKCYGINAAGIRAVARKYWPEIKPLSKKDVFDICEELMRPMMAEETILATLWLPKFKKQFEEKDIKLFRKWIGKYINNWATCDSLCNHTVGDFIVLFPGQIAELKAWTQSKNRWMRRASAVSLVVPAKKGEFLEDVFEIAGILLEDKDDMVQKGYGWLLKVASVKHQESVFNFVIKNKKVMPRTALRYAIEKMTPELRARALERD